MLIRVKSRMLVNGRGPTGMARFMALLCSLTLVFTGVSGAWAALPPPLNTIPVPLPVNIGDFLNSAGGVPTPAANAAVIALGKALFWDMQVGSDGQACASCHFHAGADIRSRNQVNPALNAGDTTFQVRGPNQALLPTDFPFHQLAAPVDQPASPVIRDANDVVSSMGVFLGDFVSVPILTTVNPGPGLADNGIFQPDPIFNVGAGNNTRRVEPRNTPTTINAVFNYSNFWEGRARNIFNGVNPFGELDTSARVFINNGAPGAAPTPTAVAIPDASLASQAVGPPLSPFEMSFGNRTFPDLGHKMLQANLRPLAGQRVQPNDSVFGLPNALGVNLVNPNAGLVLTYNGDQTYVGLIKQAFQAKYWNGADVTMQTVAGPTSFTQMEANFSLFWGLAVMMYERTLVSDQTKFDRFLQGQATLTASEQDGMSFFFSGSGNCSQCHAGAEFTDHSVANLRAGVPATPPGFLAPGEIIAGKTQAGVDNLFDLGMYNVAVRPTQEDIGRGGDSPFLNPLLDQPQPLPLAFSKLAQLNTQGLLPAGVAQFTPPLPQNPPNSVAVNGAFKVPLLRNVELTGPYMHDGSMSTLMQVVQFYTRGGNFPAANVADLDGDLKDHIGSLQGDDAKKRNVVDFLLTLTDPRVKSEAAPFDHPELFIPDGTGLKTSATPFALTIPSRANGHAITIQATGRRGGRPGTLTGGGTRGGQGLLMNGLGVTFLNLNPRTP